MTRVDTSGLRGEVVKGVAKTALSDPTKQTFWRAKATGTGTQTLALKLDGAPTEYVVMPIGQTGDVTVTSGIQIKNGFALSIATFVLGLLALTSGLLLLRRRRTPTEPAEDVRPTNEADAEARVSTTPSRTMSRIVTVGVIGAVVPALAGCGMVPTKVDTWKSKAITKPAMADQAEAVAAMKDYDRRNNAAIAQTAKAFDASAWQNADAGIVLANDRYSAIDRLCKDTSVVQSTTTVDKIPGLRFVPHVCPGFGQRDLAGRPRECRRRSTPTRPRCGPRQPTTSSGGRSWASRAFSARAGATPAPTAAR